MTRVIPDGPFVEVPYKLMGAWTAGGYTWGELTDADGLPQIVRERLTAPNRAWCAKVVRLYRDADDYRERCHAATMGCPVGRAWLGPRFPCGGPATTTSIPVRLITGVMSPPMVVGARQKWKW